MCLIELTFHTTHEAVDWVCTLLVDTINIHDIDIREYTEPDNHSSPWAFTMRLYLNHDLKSAKQREKILQVLSPLERTNLITAIDTVVVTEKIAASAKNLVTRVGENFIIVNDHKNGSEEITDKIPLKVQKSGAFGSGLHPATILSLQLLERHVMGDMDVLDFGSGSGILSVAIAKLGANVLAVDNDCIAVEATQESVNLNNVQDKVEVMLGSLGCGNQMGHWMGGNLKNHVPQIVAQNRFDLIVANILARVHITLADDFRGALRHGGQGLLITAGFTIDNEVDVTAALEEVGFEMIDRESSKEWVAMAYGLKVDSP